MKISKTLYEQGYHLEGEKNRIDVVKNSGMKCCEILFIGKEILIMTSVDFIWVNRIDEISAIPKGIAMKVFKKK